MSLHNRRAGEFGQSILIAWLAVNAASWSAFGQQPLGIRGVREQDEAARRTAHARNRDARAEARAQAIDDAGATPTAPNQGAASAGQTGSLQATEADLRAADLGIWLTSSPVAHDLTITDVAPDSALAAAGFRAQDGIVSINGTPVRSESQLVRSLLAPSLPEAGASVVILRDGQRQTLTISPTVVRQSIVAEDPLYQAGMVVDPSNANQVVVQQVYPRTAAYYAGLQVGDVIRGVNGQQITSATGLSQWLQSGSGADLGLVVTRGGQDRQLALNLAGGSFAADGAVRTSQQADTAQLNAGAFGANPNVQTAQSGQALSGSSLPNTSRSIGANATGAATAAANGTTPSTGIVPGALPPGRPSPALPTNPGTAGVDAGGATRGIPGVATTPSAAVLNPSTGPQNFTSPPLGAQGLNQLTPNQPTLNQPTQNQPSVRNAPLGTTPGFNSLNGGNRAATGAAGAGSSAPRGTATGTGANNAANAGGTARGAGATGAGGSAGSAAGGSGAGGSGGGGAGGGGSGGGAAGGS